MDDFALFSDDQGWLVEARESIEADLASLRLKVHPIKTQIFETCHGANFLGFRVFPNRIRVRTDNLRRSRRRLKQLQTDYANYRIDLPTVMRSLQSWEAHLKHGDTWQLRQQIFTALVFSRG